MSEFPFEVEVDDLPPVRTFVDGDLVDLDAEQQAIAPINQMSKHVDISLATFEAIDEMAATELGISLSGSIEGCIRRAVEAQNKAAALVLEAGYLMLKIKAECEHGEFEKRLNAHGISRQRAAELMATAKFYTRLEPVQRKQVFSLPKTKLMALAAADSEVVKDLLDDPGVDLTLSVRELRQRLRDMENAESHQVKVLKADIEHKETLLAKMKKRNPVYEFLPQTHLIREECLAHQAEAELALNSLRQLFDDCVNDENPVERGLRYEQVWVTIHVVAARAMDALAFLRGYGMEGMPDSIGLQNRLTDDEALRWLDDYESVERKHINAKLDRHDKREAAKPKGPGRPRKEK